MLNIRELRPGLGEAVASGLGRETGPMLDAPKALLLRGCHDQAIADKAGGRIAMIRIQSKDEGYPAPLLVLADTMKPARAQANIADSRNSAATTQHCAQRDSTGP